MHPYFHRTKFTDHRIRIQYNFYCSKSLFKCLQISRFYSLNSHFLLPPQSALSLKRCRNRGAVRESWSIFSPVAPPAPVLWPIVKRPLARLLSRQLYENSKHLCSRLISPSIYKLQQLTLLQKNHS